MQIENRKYRNFATYNKHFECYNIVNNFLEES